MDEKDLATMAIPLDFFTDVVKLNGQEMVKKHQDLIEDGVVVEFDGVEKVILSRYISNVLDDLEYLSLRAKTLESEETIGDYVFLSEKYLEIFTHILIGRNQFATSSGDKVTEDYVREAWKNALGYFQALYEHTYAAINISLESGPLASSKE